METPIFDVIHSHGSCRHYKPDPVPVELVEKLVVAGQRASSSSNMQTVSVVAVTNPEARAELDAEKLKPDWKRFSLTMPRFGKSPKKTYQAATTCHDGKLNLGALQ